MMQCERLVMDWIFYVFKPCGSGIYWRQDLTHFWEPWDPSSLFWFPIISSIKLKKVELSEFNSFYIWCHLAVRLNFASTVLKVLSFDCLFRARIKEEGCSRLMIVRVKYYHILWPELKNKFFRDVPYWATHYIGARV